MFYLGLAVLLFVLTFGALFFSVSAITLRSYSRARLLEAFKAADRENYAEELMGRSETLILACTLYRLILNMSILLLVLAVLVHLGRGAIDLVDYLLAFFIALMIFSVFSVAIPHALAKYAGEKILGKTYKPLIFFSGFSMPLLYVLGLYDGFIKRLLGVVETTPEELQEEKQEEFLTDLEQHRMEGVVDEEEQEMIENVLELSETTADEIMTPRTDITAIEADSDLEKILQIINSAGHSRYPVYEENIDNIIGLVYAKDLLTEIGKNPQDFKLRDKIRQAYFVPETKALRTLLHEFQNQKLHIAVVLDEYGGTAGIVTIEDVLEELVGEITDEYEKTVAKPIKKIDPQTYEIDARVYIDDLNDQAQISLPEDEDYDTVGGFVFSHLGYIPKTGETFDYENLQFTITSAETRKIKRIKIHKIAEQ